MRRSVLALIAPLALGVPRASADDAKPTPEQLEQAKQAFKEGNALYKDGKFAESVEKLRESYRLSHNAVLLYNIGNILEQAGNEDQALFYYRKFLHDAPPDAPVRKEATERIAALEKEGIVASADPDAPAPASTTPAEPPAKKLEIQHQLVESAPPGLPLDITAAIPGDAHVTLTLSYRSGGEATFIKLPMVARKDVLIARIPPERVAGRQLQYFIEAKDDSGALVTRSGRSTAPNLVQIETTAKPHYDTTMADDGTDAPPGAPERKPLAVYVPPSLVTEPAHEGPPIRLATVKWIATGTAGALLATSLVSYLIAGHEHDTLVADSKSCGTPPCREFDLAHDQKLQDLGERYDTIYKVTLGVGLGVTAVAGYLWYRDLREHSDKGVAVAPAIAPGTAGITAVGRF